MQNRGLLENQFNIHCIKRKLNLSYSSNINPTVGFFPSVAKPQNKDGTKQEEHTDIPKWIQNLFNEVNYINKNGILSCTSMPYFSHM